MPSPTRQKNRSEQYINDVLSGKQVTSKLVRLAIERHRDDLTTASKRNLKFSPDHGQRAIDFIEFFCHHSTGEWAGTKVKLEPWECALLYVLYGWRWADTGYKRFRTAYVELAKGNGKSFLASAVALYELIGTGEPGSEVFSAAVTREQAKIVFDEATFMVAKSPALKKRIRKTRNNLHIPGTPAKFQPLSSETGALDGKRPQCIVADEIHRWGAGGRELWDLLVNSFGKRRSPLFLVITTAGSGAESLARQQHDYSEKVLTGVHEDDSWFAFICCMDSNEPSEYTDERNWIKANPNLGVSVKIKELREALNKALGDPAALNGTLRLRFGVWTSTHEQWMALDKWDACDEPVDAGALKGRPCYAGMDLSSSDDITAVVLLFPPYGDDKLWRVIPYFFLPADNIERRVKKDRVPYDRWRDQGLFILTDGNVLDTQFILEKIKQLADVYTIKALCFDRSFAADIIPQIEATGLTCAVINQGDVAMTPPTKRLMEMVLRKEIATNQNPVLRWMVSNVIVRIGPTGLLKPDKSKNREKIDGISALLDAVAHAMLQPPEQAPMSASDYFMVA
jgi:phage terminase large subunit-like protein